MFPLGGRHRSCALTPPSCTSTKFSRTLMLYFGLMQTFVHRPLFSTVGSAKGKHLANQQTRLFTHLGLRIFLVFI